MRSTFMTYEYITLLVPSTVEAYTKAEALEMFRNGEGRLDISKPVEEKQDGFIEGQFEVVEID